MSIIPTDVVPLRTEHLLDARLFADRLDLMRHIRGLLLSSSTATPNILEIGVAVGDFSAFLIEELSPAHFTAVDLFDLHQSEVIWGMPTVEMFQGRTHLDFYADRLAGIYSGTVRIEQGLSGEATARLPDDFYDIIYIDAGHSYENVIEDARISMAKIRLGGFIVFNDYLMMDHLYGTPYGVVRATNEMITESERLKVIGLGLNCQMFCDLAVRVVA